jgi:hypothetical protein
VLVVADVEGGEVDVPGLAGDSGAGTTWPNGITRSAMIASTAGRTFVIATRCANSASVR